LQMSIEGQDESGPLLHEANPGMLSAVDPPRMALGLTEPTFQVQIIWR